MYSRKKSNQKLAILTSIVVLATFFTLVMSNVGATILLVPIAVNIAIQVGEDPAIYALAVIVISPPALMKSATL
jgi:di/tricarboxylate transporter